MSEYVSGLKRAIEIIEDERDNTIKFNSKMAMHTDLGMAQAKFVIQEEIDKLEAKDE